MSDTKSRQNEGIQGIATVVGISLGLIPLIQMALRGRPGVLRFVLGDSPGITGYVVAAVILLVAIAVVALAEAKKSG